jgi:hypothetical protein
MFTVAAGQESVMVDYNRQVQIRIVKVDGIEYCCTRPGYYYKKAAVGHERISQEEWEEALAWASDMPEEKSSKTDPEKEQTPPPVEEESSAVSETLDVRQGSNEIPVAVEEESSENSFWDGYMY